MPPRIQVAIAFSLILGSCSKPAEKEKEKAAPPVQVTPVTQNTIRRIVQGDGALYPVDQAAVMPKLSAPVKQFYVNRGAHVKKGQLLAVLENRDLVFAAAESKGAVTQAESNLRTTQISTVADAIAKAKSDVDGARATRDSAKAVLDARQKLFQQGALAGRTVDEAQVAFTQAENQLRAAQEHLNSLEASRKDQIQSASAQVESAKAHFDSQEAQVAYSRIESPISGIVADRPLNAGEMASSGAPLITIVDVSRVVARINVPQSDAVTVKVGQVASLSQTGSQLDGQADAAEEIEGKVTVVSPAADPNTTTVQVWIEVPNPGEKLKPGAAVHAKIATEVYKAATVVPAEAILPGEEGGTSVLTVSSDSVAHRRNVKLGVREGKQVQILTGVTPGEEVVIVGGMGLDDKTKVKIVTTATEEPEDEPEDNAPPTPAEKGAAKPGAAKQK